MINVVLVELALATVAGIVFVAYYTWTSRHANGGPAVRSARRHMIAVSVAMAGEAASLLALGLGVPVPAWVFAIGYGVIDVVVVHRLILLWRATHRTTSQERTPN